MTDSPRTAGLELKIPPVAVVIVAALLMVATRFVVPALSMPPVLKIGVPVLCLVVAAFFGLGAVSKFSRARTTVNPLKPDAASSLVTTGIYGISRNPMYTGLAFALLALAVWLANGLALVVLPAFVAYLTRFQIIPEERALSRNFGAEFAAYQKQTRRWI